MRRKEVRGLYKAATGGSGAPFVPTDISDLILWLDADDSGTIITDIDEFVSGWNDKSGVGNDLSQTSGSNQPATEVLTINGMNVILFDGTNDFLEIDPISVDNSITLFIVSHVFSSDLSNLDAMLSFNAIDDFQLNASAGPTWMGNLNDTGLGIGQLQTPSDISDSDTLLTYVFDGTGMTVKMSLEFSEVDSSSYNGNLDTSQHMRLGISRIENRPMSFKAAEILMYNRMLGSSEIADAQQYLLDKWGMP